MRLRHRSFTWASPSVILFALTVGCRKTTATRGDDELLAAREAAALAWVNALGAGDGATLTRATADAFTFRSAGTDRTCEGRISGGRALDGWFACARARPDLQQLAEAWKLCHDAAPRSSESAPESAALKRYLPRVVGGDEAWSRFIGADERRHADEALTALTKEVGDDGAWITISATWLYTTLVLRAQVVGAAAAPRVHAVLVDVTRTTE